jgi:hypothetical protein
VSINEEPYAGNPQVRFCEGNSSSHNYLLGEKYMTTRQKKFGNSVLALIFLGISTPGFAAPVEYEVRCVPGTPSTDSDTIKITEITSTIHWVGNMMEGYYAGTIELKGDSFANGDEKIDVQARPFYSQLNFWANGAVGYGIETYGDVLNQVGENFVGTFTMKNADHWTKSTELVCVRSL